jgi:hypothetical protein
LELEGELEGWARGDRGFRPTNLCCSPPTKRGERSERGSGGRCGRDGDDGHRLPNLGGEGMENGGVYVPVFLSLSGQEHWIRGYEHRLRRFRCDRTSVRF